MTERSDLYPPGLLRLGLDPARIILAHAKDAPARLAALETALRVGLHGIGQEKLTRFAARRLALAVRQGGGVGFILAPQTAQRFHRLRQPLADYPGRITPARHAALAR